MLIDSGFVTSSLRISGSFTQTGNAVITGSLTATQGITGSLFGTASWANNVISASIADNAVTASRALNANTASFATNAANATTASFATNAISASYALSASYATGSGFASSASFALSSSIASRAVTASYAISASYLSGSVDSASYAVTALTASRALNANTASFATSAASATTASYILNAASASYALTASHALNAGGGAAAASNLIFSGSVSASVDVTSTQIFRLISGSSTFMQVSNNGYIGIGTSVPVAQLHLSGAAAIRLSNTANITSYEIGLLGGISDANAYVYQRANAALILGTNNTDRIRITGDGNVGIGTTTPTVRLEVSGSGKFTVGVNGTVDITDSGTITLRNQIGAEGRFGTFSNHDLVLTTNNTSRVTITSGGNVGIGTTAPINTLQIVGTTATDHSITDINGAYRIFKPRGGTYVTQTSTVNGAIKLVYPVGFTNTMHTIKAKVYEYITQQSFTVTLGGYNYSVDQSWYNVFAQIEGDAAIDRNFPVRFGFSGSNCVAYIGNLNSTWAYPQVFIEEVTLGYSGFAAGWTGSWAIDFETVAFRSASVAGLATVANTNAHNFARNGTSTYYSIGSVGIGTTSPASLLHVNGTISSSTLYINSSLGSYFVGDAGGTTFTGGTGYFYFNQSNPLYVQPTLISRTAISNDTATYLTINGGTSNHTYVNGNIGVGITSPAARLHISGASNSMLRIESQDNSDTTPTVYIEGNKSKGPPGLATSVEIRSDVDFRGRGITLSVSESNARWFAGVPYQGSGYSIGYDATANRLPHYYQSSSLFIASNRNVGVGTTGPTRTLSIGGTSNAYMSFNPSSNRTTTIGSDGFGNFIVYDDTGAAYRMVISGSNGNVGIGTTNPGHKFDVQGGRMRIIDTTSSPGIWLVGTGADDVFIGLQGNTSTSAFGIYSGTSWRFTMLNGGNVGIGTTAPAGQLEVTRPSSGFHLILNSSHPNSSSFTQYRINGSGGWEHGMAGLADSYKYYFSYGAIGAANAKVTFQNDGNVGIGTTAPGAILDVNGRIRLGSNAQTEIYSSGNRVVFRAENSDNVGQFATYGMFLPVTGQTFNLYLAGSMQLGYTDTSPVISMARGSSGAITYIQLAANGSSYFNGGSVGIGTTSPGTILDVVGNQTRISGNSSTTGELSVFSGQLGSTAVQRLLVSQSYADVYQLRVRGISAGAFNATTYALIDTAGTGYFAGDVVAFYSFSDANLKTNISPITNALDKVVKLKGVNYEWKDGYRAGKQEIGLIAQQVEEVVPEVVRTQTRLEGEQQNAYKMVDYDHLSALLVEAVKEQQKQIDELKYLLQNKQ